jgi:hypothetical protein
MPPPRKRVGPLRSETTRKVNLNLAFNIGADPAIAQAKRRRRERLFRSWTHHAQWLAGQFAETGDWRAFKALLRHVMAARQRLRGDLA